MPVTYRIWHGPGSRMAVRTKKSPRFCNLGLNPPWRRWRRQTVQSGYPVMGAQTFAAVSFSRVASLARAIAALQYILANCFGVLALSRSPFTLWSFAYGMHDQLD